MNAYQHNNLRRIANLFKSFETAPSPQQLKQVLNELEYKRFIEALGLHEIIKCTESEQDKQHLSWADLPSDYDIHFFNNYGYLTI